MTQPGAKTSLRWMPPSDEARTAFVDLKETLARSLSEAAALCSKLRCFNVPDFLHQACVEEIRPTEGLLATIEIGRSTARALLACQDPEESLKLATRTILLTGCLLQIYGLVLKQGRAGDA